MYQTDITAQRIVLQSPQAEAEIFCFGALLNRYQILLAEGGWHNAVAAFYSTDHARSSLTDAFRSAKLSPFPCRLNQGRYIYAGQSRQTGRHIVNGHAIHGLLYDAEFAVAGSGSDAQSAWVELTYDFSGSSGYPFAYRLNIVYRLSEQGLGIATTVTNNGTETMPLADGWHPYFSLGGSIDEHSLYAAAAEQLEFNDELLPTGRVLPDSRFQAALPLNGIELDNSFVLNGQSADQPACTLQRGNLILDIFAETGYPLLQLYIPPERDCIAIENLSGAPDCFNNGIGLTELAPAHSTTFRCRYRLYQR